MAFTTSKATSPTAELLRSGEHSDLTIICDDHEFRVHKPIIYLRSPYIAKLVHKEARIHVYHDRTTLECMLQYIYLGDYKEKPKNHVRLLQLAYSTQDRNNQRAQSMETPKGEEQPMTVSEALIYHARVINIAEHYGVGGLLELSTNRLMALLNDHWSADAFCDLAEKSKELSIGFATLKMIAATNIVELLSKNIFSDGKVPSNIAGEILQLSAKKIVGKMNELNREVQTGKKMIKRLEDRLYSLEDNLCCNDCGSMNVRCEEEEEY